VMVSKLISFLLFSSLVVCFSICEYVNRNNTSISRDSFRAEPNTFVLVNPRQVHRLERAIRNFLSKIAMPVDKPIVLTRSASRTNELQSTIREICECIRKRLMQFANDCGLINTVQRYELGSSEDPLSDDWYSEMLLQTVYMMRDLGNMINEIRSSINLYLGGGNATSLVSKRSSRQTNSFKFLGVVHEAAEFSDKLTQCLLQMADTRRHESSSFSLNRAILNLVKHSPKITLKTLKSKIDKVSRDTSKTGTWQKPWQIFFCVSMINEDVDYDDCIRELQQLDTCLISLQQEPKNEMYNADVKSWTRAIRHLSDCKIMTDKYGETKVSCESARRIPRKTKRKTKYVLERMLSKRISKGSAFQRAVDDLGNTLSESRWGERFIDELCQYISIYEDGQKKLQRFSKFADKNKIGYREVLNAMNSFEKGVLLRTFGTMNKLHRFAIDLEKFFAQGMKDTLMEAWQSHVKVLSCLMDWMTKLLELHMGESFSGKEPSSSDTSTSQVEWNSDEDSNSENMQELVDARSQSEIMKDADNSMNSLIESMNHLSKYRNTNNKSLLACIANNLLLVMIFMETVGFISSLYCFGQATKEQNSLEIENEWHRVRRSLYPMEYDKIVDLTS
ncbi:hypothetical protein WN48_00760, partial [Eufriesea mexicana]